jgi:hypothetical protein
VVRRAVLILLALAACRDSTGSVSDLPPSAERFAALPAYDLWWSMTESCSGLSGDLSAVRFYRAAPGDVDAREGGADAYWSAGSNSIVVRSDAIHAGDLVRHEMLHALARGGGHPRSYFLERCAGVVVCLDACITEAGPPPDPPAGARAATPDDLELSVEVTPPESERARYGGAIAVTVLARNPSADPIVVALPPSRDGGPPPSFGYRLTLFGFELSRDEGAHDPSVTIFTAGETKRFVFDFFANQPSLPNGLVPGFYQVRGAFGQRLSASVALTVAP